jgi:catechol 2,3-dioxygenase-like lactoylglutathione lyase family enzyme
MKISVEHIGLPARNPSALKDWYVDALGAKVIHDNGQSPPAYLLAWAGGSMVEIYQSVSAIKETGDNMLAGWRHLALQVESIETAREALEKKGVKFTDPVKPAVGGGRVLFFRDAEDNLLHLVERAGGSALRNP